MGQKIYIAGKITGATREELDQFALMEATLTEAGHTPVAPIRNGQPTNGLPYEAEWIDHIAADLKILHECDAAIFLPGYKNSKGARIEHAFASITGKTILYKPDSKNDELREIIEKVVGVDDLTKNTKKQEYFAARVIMASFCKIRSMSHKQTAQIVRRAPGSICNMYKQHEAFSKTWPQYRAWFKQVQEELAARENII